MRENRQFKAFSRSSITWNAKDRNTRPSPPTRGDECSMVHICGKNCTNRNFLTYDRRGSFGQFLNIFSVDADVIIRIGIISTSKMNPGRSPPFGDLCDDCEHVYPRNGKNWGQNSQDPLL